MTGYKPNPPLNDGTLAHFGVKGMRWGVRKGYTDRHGATAARLSRVASGTGSKSDNATALYRDLSTASIIKNRGVKGAAAAKGTELQAHIDRINSGKATTSDLLRMYGTVGIGDIRVTRK